MSKKKKIFISIGAVLLAGLIIGGIFLGLYLKNLKEYRERIKSITIEDIDISKLSDGKYIGSYDAILNYAKVEVTVVDGKITDVVFIEYKRVRGESAEDVIDKVKAQQTLQVDVVTGATNSSNVILKAIENALKSTPVFTGATK